ncbi:hypothetical protein Bpfe_004596, partial [Biomphalaria pfeifferi]
MKFQGIHSFIDRVCLTKPEDTFLRIRWMANSKVHVSLQFQDCITNDIYSTDML